MAKPQPDPEGMQKLRNNMSSVLNQPRKRRCLSIYQQVKLNNWPIEKTCALYQVSSTWYRKQVYQNQIAWDITCENVRRLRSIESKQREILRNVRPDIIDDAVLKLYHNIYECNIPDDIDSSDAYSNPNLKMCKAIADVKFNSRINSINRIAALCKPELCEIGDKIELYDILWMEIYDDLEEDNSLDDDDCLDDNIIEYDDEVILSYKDKINSIWDSKHPSISYPNRYNNHNNTNT